jgi:hypothetical protein
MTQSGDYRRSSRRDRQPSSVLGPCGVPRGRRPKRACSQSPRKPKGGGPLSGADRVSRDDRQRARSAQRRRHRARGSSPPSRDQFAISSTFARRCRSFATSAAIDPSLSRAPTRSIKSEENRRVARGARLQPLGSRYLSLHAPEQRDRAVAIIVDARRRLYELLAKG